MKPGAVLERLFAAGVTGDLSPAESKRTRIINKIALCCSGVSTSYVFSYLLLGYPQIAAVIACCVVGYASVVLSNRIGLRRAAPVLMIATGNANIFSLAALLGPAAGLEFFYVACVLGLFMLFDLRRRFTLASWTVVTLALLGLNFALADRMAPPFPLPEKLAGLLFQGNFLITVAMCAAFAFYLVRENDRALTTIQELKTQQDADYFLTTLLLDPLSPREFAGGGFHVDFLTRQYKAFRFRRWERSIGGDLSSAHAIELRGRPYVALLNADAMGKSLQGAGGALVAGSVFHAIAQRAEFQKAVRDQTPEQWVKSAFKELHGVFEGFDGAMLVSVFLALCEEDTGVVYYISAEHPRGVLLRDGRAEFFEPDEWTYRKLGTQGVIGRVRVDTFEMKPGDSLIVGSDGRDDVVLAHDDAGERIINTDENMFLRHVERAGGDLNRIAESIATEGELMDDLSLVRIRREKREMAAVVATPEQATLLAAARDLAAAGALEDAVQKLEAHVERQGHPDPELAAARAKLYGAMGEFGRAAELAVECARRRPGHAPYLRLAALYQRRVGKVAEALEYVERLRLRGENRPETLALLGDLRTQAGKLSKARKALEELERMAPGSPAHRYLKKRLAGATPRPG